MRRTITSLVFAALVSGGLGACASTQDVKVVSPLDPGGNVNVHQEGTANVTVTNPSLPVTGAVNVSGTVNVANLAGRVTKVADNVTLPNISGQAFPFPPLDTSTCHSLAAFTRGATPADNVGGVTISLDLSADGNFVGRLSPVTVPAPGHPGRTDYFPVPGGQGLPATAPQAQVLVQNSTGAPVTFSVWLLCSR